MSSLFSKFALHIRPKPRVRPRVVSRYQLAEETMLIDGCERRVSLEIYRHSSPRSRMPAGSRQGASNSFRPFDVFLADHQDAAERSETLFSTDLHLSLRVPFQPPARQDLYIDLATVACIFTSDFDLDEERLGRFCVSKNAASFLRPRKTPHYWERLFAATYPPFAISGFDIRHWQQWSVYVVRRNHLRFQPLDSTQESSFLFDLLVHEVLGWLLFSLGNPQTFAQTVSALATPTRTPLPLLRFPPVGYVAALVAACLGIPRVGLLFLRRRRKHELLDLSRSLNAVLTKACRNVEVFLKDSFLEKVALKETALNSSKILLKGNANISGLEGTTDAWRKTVEKRIEIAATLLALGLAGYQLFHD